MDWFNKATTAVMIATLIGICVFVAFKGMRQQKSAEVGVWYKQFKVDVNCGEKFKGIAYKLGHTTSYMYSIRYKLENDSEIFLPREQCVIIELEEYIKPKPKLKKVD